MALAANVHEPMAMPWVIWVVHFSFCARMSLPSGFGRWILVLSVATGCYTLSLPTVEPWVDLDRWFSFLAFVHDHAIGIFGGILHATFNNQGFYPPCFWREKR